MASTTSDMFGYGDELRRISERMRAAMEPCRQMQESLNRQLEPYRQMQEQIERQLRPFRQMQEQIQQQLEPFRQMQENLHRQLEPFRRMKEQARQMNEPLLRMQEQLEPFFQMRSRFASSLEDYNPTFESVDDGFVVDGNKYTVDDFNHAVSDINKLESKWDSLPKPLKYLIILIIGFMFQDAYNYCKSCIRSQTAAISHMQKQEVKAVKKDIKSSAANDVRPFVTQDNLPVYARAKRKSQVLEYLPFQTEVKILEYRNKKRWLLIEWQEGDQTNRGWVFGRYVFRPSKYWRAN